MVRTLDLAGAAALVLIGLGALTYVAVGALAAYASWRRIRRTEDLYDRAARDLDEEKQDDLPPQTPRRGVWGGEERRES